MDSYRDANAPPPYDGPGEPYYPPEKFGSPLNPEGLPHQSQGPPGYTSHGSGYAQQGYAQQEYPPPGYAPPTQASYGACTPQVNISSQPPVQIIYRDIAVDQKRIITNCPQCHEHIRTRIWRTNSMKTHLFALLLCLFCCWPCVCLPYCLPSCKDATHTCPKCKTIIGTYRA